MISTIALTVSACGGGGGGGGGGGVSANLSERAFIASLNTRTVAEIDVLVKSGGITGGVSKGGYTGTLSNTLPSVSINTDTNQLTLGIGGDAGSTRTVTITSDIDPTSENFDGVEVEVGGETKYTVHHLDDSDNTKTAEALVYVTSGATNTDYAVFGYWLYDSDTTLDNSNTDFGAFMLTSNTPTTNAQFPNSGRATYSGDFAGVETEGARATPRSGTVEMTVNFGNAPTDATLTGEIDFGSIGKLEWENRPDVDAQGAIGPGVGFEMARFKNIPSGYTGGTLVGWFFDDAAGELGGVVDLQNTLLTTDATKRLTGSFYAPKEE